MIKRRGQEQSLVERRKNRYGARRNYFRICYFCSVLYDG